MSKQALAMRVWQSKSLTAWLLLPLAGIFGLLGGLRRLMYRMQWLKSQRLPVPVVVVGNVFVGGTGKTPFTIWLVEQLRCLGLHPGIVSRGYGANVIGTQLVSATARADEVGDEPLLMAQRTGCPVMVGRDRSQAGLDLLVLHPEINVIVCDDGLQHYRLQRDVEIVVSDQRGNGNGWLLPAGPLREPASRRRDFSVINGHPSSSPEQHCYAMTLVGEFAYALHDAAQRMSLTHVATQCEAGQGKVAAVAGIGNPERFFSMLKAQGIEAATYPLPDHAVFTEQTFDGIEADWILMTEKDAVKCHNLDALRADRRLWVVPVVAQIDPALALAIVEKLRGHSPA